MLYFNIVALIVSLQHKISTTSTTDSSPSYLTADEVYYLKVSLSTPNVRKHLEASAEYWVIVSDVWTLQPDQEGVFVFTNMSDWKCGSRWHTFHQRRESGLSNPQLLLLIWMRRTTRLHADLCKLLHWSVFQTRWLLKNDAQVWKEVWSTSTDEHYNCKIELPCQCLPVSGGK